MKSKDSLKTNASLNLITQWQFR